MTTIDLRQHKATVDELLNLADGGMVVIIAENGREFVLEEADEFEKEVIWLSGSAKFVDFLKARAKEPATISIDDLEKS